MNSRSLYNQCILFSIQFLRFFSQFFQLCLLLRREFHIGCRQVLAKLAMPRIGCRLLPHPIRIVLPSIKKAFHLRGGCGRSGLDRGAEFRLDIRISHGLQIFGQPFLHPQQTTIQGKQSATVVAVSFLVLSERLGRNPSDGESPCERRR
jgi:hypothetical protein